MTKTALVTGGNRGIGLEICRGLAKDGWRVVLGSRDLGNGEKAASEIDGDVLPEQIDQSEEGSIRSLKKRLDDKGVRVDALVNNGAIYREGDALEVDPEAIEESWRVNVLGPWRLCQTFVPGMVDRNWGRVVNVSSGSGALDSGGDPQHAAYGVSKTALNALTVNLDRATPDAVKVNTMCPGWVHTRMGGESAPRTPEEGADTAIYLATLPDDGPSGMFFRDRQPIAW
jgi:NAD(P)-dependent dehydrogenase (short-subunit alcohol dehydrogenase family)